MNAKKTKSIENIEQKMEGIDETTLRYKVLNDAKEFKTSWIDLGQSLYNVWKEKEYKEWGYTEFDAYAQKEIGIRKQTALKLIQSYSFLEKEEPMYIKKEYNEEAETASVPTLEAVDVLRRAKNNKNLDEDDYRGVRKYVLEDGCDAKEVQRNVTSMVKEREELDPEEVRQKKRMTLLKRLVSMLKSLRTEIKVSGMLPDKVMKETESLISVLEREVECG